MTSLANILHFLCYLCPSKQAKRLLHIVFSARITSFQIEVKPTIKVWWQKNLYLYFSTEVYISNIQNQPKHWPVCALFFFFSSLRTSIVIYNRAEGLAPDINLLHKISKMIETIGNVKQSNGRKRFFNILIWKSHRRLFFCCILSTVAFITAIQHPICHL